MGWAPGALLPTTPRAKAQTLSPGFTPRTACNSCCRPPNILPSDTCSQPRSKTGSSRLHSRCACACRVARLDAEVALSTHMGLHPGIGPGAGGQADGLNQDVPLGSFPFLPFCKSNEKTQ